MESQKDQIDVIVRIKPFMKRKESQQFVLPVDIGSNDIKVFTAEADQNEIFEHIYPNLIPVLDGYNFTLIAYGQTGSGKTHSMLGPDGKLSLNAQYMGVIPRASQFLFSQISRSEDSVQVRVVFFEIYQNKIKDLLNDSQQVNGDLKLLEERVVKSTKQILQIIEEGSKIRATCSTDLNEHSSRSHAILQIRIERRQKIDQKRVKNYLGLINLIDLAGSEDITRSNVQGEHLREAVKINSDLFHLHRVFNAIQNQEAFVPFRDSNLTFFLQPFLIGNSRTIFMTHVSSEQADIVETVSTLKYAIMASKIKTENFAQVELEKVIDPMLNDYPDPYLYNRQTCSIETSYGKVFARISCQNNQRQKLILFVHGSGPENSSMWWNFFTNQLLQYCKFFFVSIDCPGYGRSEGDKQTIRSYPAELLKEVINHLGYEKAYCLIGSSQGAAAVFNSIVQRPDICNFFAVTEPVSHDPFRFSSIQQPCLLIYDTEDEGHPVKVGRIVKKTIAHSWYYEFTNSTQPNYLKFNFAKKLIELFQTFDPAFNQIQQRSQNEESKIPIHQKLEELKYASQIHHQQIVYTKYMTLRGGVLSWCRPFGRETDWYGDANESTDIQNLLEAQALEKQDDLFNEKPKKKEPKEIPTNCSLCKISLEGLQAFDIPNCCHRICCDCSQGTLDIDNQLCPVPRCEKVIDPPLKIKKRPLNKNQIIIKFGNTAKKIKSKITFKAFVLDPSKSINSVAFDINPGYPKSAVKVSNAPFELKRTMEGSFPCNFIITWKRENVPPLIISYDVYEKPKKFLKTLIVTFKKSQSQGKRKQMPVEYLWCDRDPDQPFTSIVNIE